MRWAVATKICWEGLEDSSMVSIVGAYLIEYDVGSVPCQEESFLDCELAPVC